MNVGVLSDRKSLECLGLETLKKAAELHGINLRGKTKKVIVVGAIRSFFLAKNQVSKNNLAYVYIRFCLNNVFINVLDEKKRTLFFFSGGRLGSKGTLRTNNFILQGLGEKIGLKISRLKIERVCIFFRSINGNRNFFLKGLKNCGLNVLLISELGSLPHNGCRLPKKRRV
jgi:small subunit ribosomal protein S11